MLQVVCNSCILDSLVSSEIKACLRDVNLPIGSNYKLQSMLYSQKHFFFFHSAQLHIYRCKFKNAVVGSCVKDKTTSNLMPPLPGGIWRPVIILYLEFYLFGDQKFLEWPLHIFTLSFYLLEFFILATKNFKRIKRQTSHLLKKDLMF